MDRLKHQGEPKRVENSVESALAPKSVGERQRLLENSDRNHTEQMCQTNCGHTQPEATPNFLRLVPMKAEVSSGHSADGHTRGFRQEA